MTWQDLVLTVGTFIFILALLPSILSKDKPALSSSLITGAVLVIFVLTYLSLSFWLTAFAVALNSLTWLTLAYQKYHATRKESSPTNHEGK
jgi:threonine/homoserine/homoserine lactone efflux protein